MKTSIHGGIAVAALCALLTACGGGGDSGGSTDTPPPPTVLPASVAIANDARAEAGAASTFSTNLAVTTGLAFRWDFGDGSTGTGASASHAYAKPGTYQVTLAVANDAEDLRTATSTIQVGAYANVTGLACSQADSGGWCWQHAIVTGHQINDVFFTDATHAWAVGDALTVLKSSDGGSTWSAVPIDATLANASLRSVRFYDAAHGMALDDQGGALQTADGGNTWTPTSFGGAFFGSPLNFVVYGGSRIIVQATYGNGAMSVDGGSTWTVVGASGPIQPTSTDCWSFSSSSATVAAGCSAAVSTPLSSYMANGYTYFAAGSFASDSQALVVGTGISFSTYTPTSWGWSTADGGLTWTPFTPNGLPMYAYSSMTLHMNDSQSGVLYSPNNLAAWVTANAGRDWAPLASSSALTQAYSFYVSTGLVGNNVLWQSVSNRLATSTDLGQTWHDAVVHAEDASSQTGQAIPLALTQYIDANHFVVAMNHRFYATADAGQTFRQLLGGDSRDTGSAYAVGEFSDIRNGRFLTSNGALLSTADGGRTWTRQDYPSTTNSPVALHFTSATEGWLILNGALAHSTDGGATWSTPLTPSGMTNLQGMSWGDATHALAWSYSQLFVTADGGSTWTQAVMPNNMGVNTAIMTGPLTGVAGSSYGSAATTQDGGATWQVVSAAPQLGKLVRATGQTVWSSNGYGLLRSKDGGHTWRTAGPNVNPTITGLAFADDSHGWMITSGGSVLRTIDGGDSWTAQPVGTDLSLQAVVAVDTQTAWIITNNGQILSTATAGD